MPPSSYAHALAVVRENDAPASFSPSPSAMPEDGVKGRGAPRARNEARWTRPVRRPVSTADVHRGGVPERPLTPAGGRGIPMPSALPWADRHQWPAGSGAASSQAHMSLFSVIDPGEITCFSSLEEDALS